MKANRIVPGCMCIVLPNATSLFVGQQCTAITRMPPGAKDKHGQDIGGNWLTDLPPIGDIKRWTVRENYLMRIDDPDIQQEIEAEKPMEKPKDVVDS